MERTIFEKLQEEAAYEAKRQAEAADLLESMRHRLIRIIEEEPFEELDEAIVNEILKDKPKHITKQLILEACEANPYLCVYHYDSADLIGLDGFNRQSPKPKKDMSRATLQRFIEENFNQWTIVPDDGYTITWEAFPDYNGQVITIGLIKDFNHNGDSDYILEAQISEVLHLN